MMAFLGGGAGVDNPLRDARYRCLLCCELLIRPVVLPCDPRHRLCWPCFTSFEQDCNLTCPFCRKRLHSWVRRHAHQLVDEMLWLEIQRLFPAQVAAKLRGDDLADDFFSTDEEETTPVALVQPGVLREEYEALMRKHAAERQADARAEEEASREMIQQLEEQAKAIEAEACERERLDLEFAQRLQEQLLPPSPPAVAEQDEQVVAVIGSQQNGPKQMTQTSYDNNAIISGWDYGIAPAAQAAAQAAVAVAEQEDLHRRQREQSDLEYALWLQKHLTPTLAPYAHYAGESPSSPKRSVVKLSPGSRNAGATKRPRQLLARQRSKPQIQRSAQASLDRFIVKEKS